MLDFVPMIKKYLIILLLSLATVSWAQTAPPLYDNNQNLPPDLAIGGEKKVRRIPKKKGVPKKEEEGEDKTLSKEPEKAPVTETAPVTPPSATTPPTGMSEPTPAEVKPTEPTPTGTTETEQKIDSAPVTLPTETKTETKPPFAEPPSPEEAPATPETAEQPLPENVSVVPAPTTGELPSDGGPNKDAGSNLSEALPITYHRYNENFLTDKDTVDIFKFYGRAGEGLGVIVEPKHPNMQVSVDLLGEGGELLSQTQTAAPGQTLSFQTSTLTENSSIYIQVRDVNLLVRGTAAPEVHPYSLELKPVIEAMAFPPTTPPMAAPVAPEPEEPSPPPSKPKREAGGKKGPKKGVEKDSSFLDEPWAFYAMIGAGALVLILIVLIVVRKITASKDPEEGEAFEQQETMVGEEPSPPEESQQEGENKNAD